MPFNLEPEEENSKYLCFNDQFNLSSHLTESDFGSNYLAEIDIAPINWNDQPSLILIIKEFNEHIFALNLISQSKIKDELLAIVSHDLKTPLNGIISMVESAEYSNDKT